MNPPRYSKLKRFGLVLVFVAFGLIPLTLIAFVIFPPPLGKQDYDMAVAGLMVLSGGSLAAGVGILILESRLSRKA